MANTDRILTTHVGSLPRPQELVELAFTAEGTAGRFEADAEAALEAAVSDAVRRQRDIGLDLIGDGEYGHPMGESYDFGPWLRYVFERLDGVELALATASTPPQEASGEVVLGPMSERRDWVLFSDAYGDPSSGVALPAWRPDNPWPVVRGPISYGGRAALTRDIANFKAALAENGLEEGFLNAVGPASCARLANEYYATDEELLYACADAMREEYEAIIDAGLLLQIDDPVIADNWDQISPEPSLEAYKRFTRPRIEALNHAIRGLPPERIRFHLCWGSWHGPHVTDIPLADIIDLMLAVNAGAYSFEAANVRHEHEWRVWQEVALPEGTRLLPGVVSHATNVVEHPELVADRICRYAEIVGRENVIASTDCGLGGRVHPQIAWAKLESLVQGAAIAGERLWKR
ncbi:MAG TPA: cobalamin-independent methionine synthase II family protein [Solirubrobacteraceae bacterium]|jgi:5-methyltetrahydropteroyltriglutamate--homocysteine methyltransferase|nr:cobalamin-independent methionine synthase II family protein [Solirubrobacteraceae bacterium]